MLKKPAAEAIGTFFLVCLGTCAIMFMGPDIGKLGIAAASGIGAVSGAHLDPAGSLGRAAGGRGQVSDLPGYVGAQVVGAIAALGGAGLVIGLTLVLIHLAGNNILGALVTPARLRAARTKLS